MTEYGYPAAGIPYPEVKGVPVGRMLYNDLVVPVGGMTDKPVMQDLTDRLRGDFRSLFPPKPQGAPTATPTDHGATINVEAPDGKVIGFAAGTDPKEIERVMSAYHQGLMKPKGKMGTGEDMLRSAGSGAVKGAASIPGLPVDTINTVSAATDWLRRKMAEGINYAGDKIGVGRPFPKAASDAAPKPLSIPGGTDDIVSGIEALSGPLHVPQTPAGKFAHSAAEWGTGSAVGPVRAIPRMATLGVVGGTASEAAGQATAGTKYEPVARGVAGLTAMTAAGIPAAARGTPGRMIASRTEGVTPQQWDEAMARQAEGNTRGVPLMGPEAMGDAGGPLQGLLSDVAVSPQGGKIQTKMRERPDQVMAAVGRELDTLGPSRQPAEVVRDVSDAARARIQAERATRTSNTKPFFEAAATQTVAKDVLAPVLTDLDDAIAKAGAQTGLGRELASYRDLLVKNMGDGDQATIGPLNQHYKEWRNGMTPQSNAMPTQAQREAAAVVGPINRKLGDILQSNNTNIDIGRRLYQIHSPAVDDLRRPEVMGNLQKAVSETGSVSAGLNRQVDVLANPKTARPESIRKIFREIDQTNKPEAARDLVRTYLENTFDAAERQGRNREFSGARFADDLMGSPTLRENTRAMIEESAKVNGQNPFEAWQGFNRFMDVLKQTERAPVTGSRTQMRAQAAGEASRSTGAAMVDAVDITRGSVVRQASNKLRELAMSKNYGELADIFTRPDSVEAMRKLAYLKPYDARAQLLVADMLGLERVSE